MATGDRGIPDGGSGLDSASTAASSADIVDVKKGWLMKESSPSSGSWHKYWFVLQDGALVYYSDPTAESKGFLDGVVDLNNVDKIGMEELSRNYGFYLQTNEPRKYRLSAITAGIRQKWMDAISAAAHLETDSEDDDDEDDDDDDEDETEEDEVVEGGNGGGEMQQNEETAKEKKVEDKVPEVAAAAAVKEPKCYYSPPMRSPATALARRYVCTNILISRRKVPCLIGCENILIP